MRSIFILFFPCHYYFFRFVSRPESDLTPTFNIYSPHSSPIFISFNFDVPPDIERLEVADETLGRVFTLTVNSIWRSRFAITIQRKDLTQGWSNVLKILWRAGAPANYKCSLRGALNMQTRLREGWRLRVVLQTLNANVTGSPINIYRDVTVETDPRASNICFVDHCYFVALPQFQITNLFFNFARYFSSRSWCG